eukprot:3553979-Amphidinium_carterae.2
MTFSQPVKYLQQGEMLPSSVFNSMSMLEVGMVQLTTEPPSLWWGAHRHTTAGCKPWKEEKAEAAKAVPGGSKKFQRR